jgi:energy-coupling factor transport system ATP-binding protein
MDRFKDENPLNLPLSTRKFVTIAAVIAMGTDILIFDEPTAGQDMAGNRRLSEILKILHGQGKTVITISHDMEFVAANFENVIVMAKKKIVRTGTPREIFWDLETLEKAMLKQPYVSRVLGALGIRGGIISIEDAVEGILNR